MSHLENITLKIWRQAGPDTAGQFDTHVIDEISDEASFLEMLDILNERLIDQGQEAIVFDHDCREGICGTCSLMIDGQAHGPQRGTATCQLHMRQFESGGFISADTGGAPDANLIPIPKPVADASMDAAECIGCGACVAACPKEISIDVIALMNGDYLAAKFKNRKKLSRV